MTDRRTATRILFVEATSPIRYRSPEEIEDLAIRTFNRGFATLGRRFGGPPVLIEEFIEFVRPHDPRIPKLHLNFEECLTRFVSPHVASGWVSGLTDLATGNLYVDSSLDPDANPARVSEYRFLLAHELGHYQLHRAELLQRLSTTESPERTIVVTRIRDDDSSSVRRIEWQANYFASCFLMPGGIVEDTIRRCCSGKLEKLADTSEGRAAAEGLVWAVQETFGVSYAAAHNRLRSFRHKSLTSPGVIPELLRRKPAIQVGA